MTLLESGPLRLDSDGHVHCFMDELGHEIELGHVDTIRDRWDVPEHAGDHVAAIQREWSDYLSDAVSDAELHAEWSRNYLADAFPF